MNIVCPLCGRHVPEYVFDPSDFDQDIYGVDVSGLGRGRGFSASEPYSILDDKRITGLIADRCHRILDMIERGSRLPKWELDALRATLESWIQYARRLEAENANLHEENKKLREAEANAQREQLESELITINDDDDEEETLAMEEMQEILDRINSGLNFEFESLNDAVEFLIESI